MLKYGSKLLDLVRYMSRDINVYRHHVLKCQSVISVVIYRTTTWQQGKEAINAISYILILVKQLAIPCMSLE
jgi:hypothetical protein